MDLQMIFEALTALVTATYAAMIVTFTSGLVKLLKGSRPGTMGTPVMVSVIIPVRNEEQNILHILEEMPGQDWPPGRMEVIVSDDQSEDATVYLTESFANSHPGFSLVLIKSPEADITLTGKKRAIERAVAKSKGEILLLTDADTCHGSGWVSAMAASFGRPGIHMVPGPVFFTGENNLLQKIQALEFLGLMGTTAGSASLGIPLMCNGANLAYRRSAFMDVGGFSGNLGYPSGDDQFIMSAVRRRFGPGSVMFNTNPGSMVSTTAEATLSGFLQQRIRWVSKSRGYRDPAVIATGVITYLTHVFLLAGILAGIFIPWLFIVSAALWLVKILLEFPLVRIMSRFFGKSELLQYYLIAQLFQLVYVPVAGLLGLFLPYRWKGRRS